MKVFLSVAIGLILLVSLLDSVFILKETEQAIILEFGKLISKNDSETGAEISSGVVTTPGLSWKIPFIQKVVKYDKRILDLNAEPTKVIDKNLEPLEVDAFVKYRIADPLLFYKRVTREREASQRLGTFLETSLRQEMGQYEITALLTKKRTQIMKNIHKDVREKAEEIGVEVLDVRIMRADYPEENTKFVYNSMRTSREEEARRYRAEGNQQSQVIRSEADKKRTFILAEAEKKASIIRGTGDAKAVKIFADAFGRDKSFYDFYRSMNAYKASMSSDNTTMVISPDSEFFKFLEKNKAK